MKDTWPVIVITLLLTGFAGLVIWGLNNSPTEEYSGWLQVSSQCKDQLKSQGAGPITENGSTLRFQDYNKTFSFSMD